MHTTKKNLCQKILVVDDDEGIRSSLSSTLSGHGYSALTAATGQDALRVMEREPCDLIISDMHMPEMTGYELCGQIRARGGEDYIPVIIMTGAEPESERIRCLDVGADDFICKPFRAAELLARVRSLLRVRELHRTTIEQSHALAKANSSLEVRMGIQVAELARLERLKHFFSPQIAEILISEHANEALGSHRRHVVVLFVDLRGFTAFSEAVDPDEVMAVLREYYQAVGEVALKNRGTIGSLAGDGIMVFFNDPIETPDFIGHAIQAAFEIRTALETLRGNWQARGYELSHGIGLAEGLATIGEIGFEDFWCYSVIGTVANLAARLCAEAKGGEILASHRFLCKISDRVEAESRGEHTLKGLRYSIQIFRLVSPKEIARA